MNMEKIAQSKYRKYLDSIDNEKDLYNAVSDMTRNRRMLMGDPGDWMNRRDTGMDKKKLKQALSRDVLNKPKYIPKYDRIYNSSLKELTPEEIKERRNAIEDILDEKVRNNKFKNRRKPMYFNTKQNNPEEYVDLIHGTNEAKAKAFLRGGNGASALQSTAYLGNGKFNDMGIQVHSLNKTRAEGYAKMQRDARGGNPAVLTGKIKRKYLYPNATQQHQGSVLSDEYELPEELFNKIKDAKIVNPETGKVVEEVKDLSGRLPYGRTKTPGSPKRVVYEDNLEDLVSKARKNPKANSHTLLNPENKGDLRRLVNKARKTQGPPTKIKMLEPEYKGNLSDLVSNARKNPKATNSKLLDYKRKSNIETLVDNARKTQGPPTKPKMLEPEYKGNLNELVGNARKTQGPPVRPKMLSPEYKGNLSDLVDNARKTQSPRNTQLLTPAQVTKPNLTSKTRNILSNKNLRRGLAVGTGTLALGGASYGLYKHHKDKQEKTAYEIVIDAFNK